MKFHDYHINEYKVTDQGETIIFDLVYGYHEDKTSHSTIRFTGVALYNFTHTNNAIVTDVYEVPLSNLLQRVSASVVEWNRMHSIKGYEGSIDQYFIYLQSSGCKAWCIESAIGFYGFVIAKTVENV